MLHEEIPLTAFAQLAPTFLTPLLCRGGSLFRVLDRASAPKPQGNVGLDVFLDESRGLLFLPCVDDVSFRRGQAFVIECLFSSCVKIGVGPCPLAQCVRGWRSPQEIGGALNFLCL